jgi:hypothetical protein
MLEIKKGVPVPVGVKSGPGRRRKYPFALMEPGDCVFIPTSEFPACGVAGVQACAHNTFGKGNYLTLVEDDGLSVWRTQ